MYSLRELIQIYYKIDYIYNFSENAKRAFGLDTTREYYLKEVKKTENELKKLVDNDIEMFLKAYEKMSKNQKEKRYAKLFFIENYLKLIGYKSKTTNTKEIEQALFSFLKKQYKECVFSKEYTSWDNPVRVDVLAINAQDLENPVIAIEIKSNNDTFERIYKQLSEYRKFATTIYVALDISHLRKFVEKYGFAFWDVGILVYYDGKLEEYKEPHLIEEQQYIDFLWTKELEIFFSHFKGKSKLPYKNKDAYKEIIKVLFTQKEIEENAKRIFVRRLSNHTININLYKSKTTKREEKIFKLLLDKKYWKCDRKLDFDRLYNDSKTSEYLF